VRKCCEAYQDCLTFARLRNQGLSLPEMIEPRGPAIRPDPSSLNPPAAMRGVGWAALRDEVIALADRRWT
jgi:hypothetical protein